jgi:hypothetical protein
MAVRHTTNTARFFLHQQNLESQHVPFLWIKLHADSFYLNKICVAQKVPLI